jgi:ParB-like chromosome segregation protein Spo0J
METARNMNDISKSSNATRDEQEMVPGELSFAILPIEQISLPRTLSDTRIPVFQGTLALFLPLIVRKERESYVIVDGSKRFRALIEAGRSHCSCGIIEADMDEKQAGLLRIQLNCGRELHAREKLLFIRWLKAFVDQEHYLRTARELGLNSAERHDFEKLSACSEHIVEAVMLGTLDPTVAPDITLLGEQDASALLRLFSAHSFSRQMQRELTEWLHEIAFNSRSSIQDILASPEITGILSSAKLNAPQKTAAVHNFAFSRRFPLYAEAKKRWKETVAAVNPDPSAVTFQAAPSFEKTCVDLHIRLNDASKATHLMQDLAAIPCEEWHKVIDPTIMLSDDQESPNI